MRLLVQITCLAKFLEVWLSVSFARLYRAARATLICVGVQTGLQVKCLCVTELASDSDNTPVLHLWGEAPHVCGLCSLADLASTWYRWVLDGLSKGLWKKIQTLN